MLHRVDSRRLGRRNGSSQRRMLASSVPVEKNRDSGWNTIAPDSDGWRLALSRSDSTSEGSGSTNSGSQSSGSLHDELWMLFRRWISVVLADVEGRDLSKKKWHWCCQGVTGEEVHKIRREYWNNRLTSADCDEEGQ